VTGANRNDSSELVHLLEARVAHPAVSQVDRPRAQNLCADAGYAGKPALATILEQGYVPHVRSRYEEEVDRQKYPDYQPRRWVVEVCHSWFNRFRKLLVRYEKTQRSFLALHHLAAAIIAFRQTTPLYGPYRRQSSS
jgi:transposase